MHIHTHTFPPLTIPPCVCIACIGVDGEVTREWPAPHRIARRLRTYPPCVCACGRSLSFTTSVRPENPVCP